MSALRQPSKTLNKPHPITVGFDGTALFRKTDGIGRYTTSLVAAYARAFPQNKVIIIGFADDTQLPTELLALSSVSLYRLPFPRKLYQAVYGRLVRIPVDFLIPKVDAFVGTNFVQYPRLANVPTLTVIHDLAYVRYPEVVEARNLRFLRKHVPRTIKEGTVIAASAYTASEMQTEFGLTKSPDIVPSGVTESHFTPPEKRQRKQYILAVGTVEPRKNLGRLITAYTRLPLTTQKAHPLVVVGNGGWGTVQPPRASTVQYTGYVSDSELVKLYQEARLFVFPSIYEGFGIPILEALASQVPVLASDIPPVRALGKGYIAYFNPWNVPEITRALQSSLKKPLSLPNLPANYFPQHSWEQSAHQLDRAIRAALQPS